ncbi:peptidase domain-containing ABC transporter [Portibacter marinus]|uniref:peptidase domain-containing ABC transporter n=1 Tax=Portibacter marinus TaxID=2898660 RepID=UPI001F31FF69|nr:ATP-binding cassette domain-containing protein [Portibacter marinus]
MEAFTPLTPLRRLQRLLAVDRKEITQVYIYALLNGLVNLSLPIGIQAIINLIQGGEMSTAWGVLVAFVLVGITLTGIFQLMQLRIVENIAQKIFTRASFEFAYRIPRIKYSELYKYYAPELANRFFDTITIQKGLPKILIDFSLASFQIIVGLIVLSMYHSFFIIFGVVLIGLVYAILLISGPKGLRTSLEESKYKYGVAHWLEEVARTKLSFKLIENQEIAMIKTDKEVSSYLTSRESHFRVLINQFFNLIGFKVLVAAGLLVIGSILVFRQEMNIGQFVAAEIIIIIIINSVEKLIKSLDSIYDVLTALEKIGAVTDMELDKEEGLTFSENFETISTSLENVSFSFSDSPKLILKDLNLKVKGGESITIMGSAGSGKSTLISLLAGINEPTDGVIRYNDLSMQSLNFVSLRKHIGFSLSNNQVFLGTLLENIAMGRDDVKTEDVINAIELVQLENFISTLPEGLNTKLDPDGKRIPRSAANKILLARALAAKPKLLILEDPLDHVPFVEKEVIMQKLTDKNAPWSIIVTTVDDAWSRYISRKITLNNGRIIGDETKDA